MKIKVYKWEVKVKSVNSTPDPSNGDYLTCLLSCEAYIHIQKVKVEGWRQMEVK